MLKKIHDELEEASRLIKEEADKDSEEGLLTPGGETTQFATEVDGAEEMEVEAEAQQAQQALQEAIQGILGEGASEEAKRKTREAIEAFAKKPRISRG